MDSRFYQRSFAIVLNKSDNSRVFAFNLFGCFFSLNFISRIDSLVGALDLLLQLSTSGGPNVIFDKLEYIVGDKVLLLVCVSPLC